MEDQRRLQPAVGQEQRVAQLRQGMPILRMHRRGNPRVWGEWREDAQNRLVAIAGLRYSSRSAEFCPVRFQRTCAGALPAASPRRSRRNRTVGTVAELPRPDRRRASETRQRILDVAQEAILAKGFDATSIEEIVAGAEITRSGFFYHFPRQERARPRAARDATIEEDRALLDGRLRAAATSSRDDPLHAFLIGAEALRRGDGRPAERPSRAASSPPSATRSGSSTQRCAPSTARWCWTGAPTSSPSSSRSPSAIPRASRSTSSRSPTCSRPRSRAASSWPRRSREPLLLARQILLQRVLHQAPLRAQLTAADPPFLCAGAAHWDIIGRTDLPLPPGADVPGRVTRRPGGVAQNIARALAALGRPRRPRRRHRPRPRRRRARGRTSPPPASTPPALHRHDGATDSLPRHRGRRRRAPRRRRRLHRPRARRRRRSLATAAARTATSSSTATCRRRSSPPSSAGPPPPLALVPGEPGEGRPPRPLLAARPADPLPQPRRGRGASAAAPSPTAAPPPPRSSPAAPPRRSSPTAPGPAAAAGPPAAVTLAAARRRARASVTGAGDVLVAAHLAARADGLDPEAALAHRARRRRPPHQPRGPMIRRPPRLLRRGRRGDRRPPPARRPRIDHHHPRHAVPGQPRDRPRRRGRGPRRRRRPRHHRRHRPAASASASSPPSSTPSPPPPTSASSPAPTSPSPSPKAGPAPPPSPPR